MDEDVKLRDLISLVLLSLSLLIAFAPVHAAESKRSQRSSRSSVLDFEADVIRGEKRQPTIFLEFESHSPTMDSIIFKRQNFNDFHSVDRRLRLHYQPDRKTRSQE